MTSSGRGSSPLARGLPCAVALAAGPAGIIPARAGFTAWDSHIITGATDHPRSRGVYAVHSEHTAEISGSSPLARGLHVITGADVAYARIIPARAGFTGHARCRASHRGDHPRSRGVYAARRAPARPRGGSSPLARGLPIRNPQTYVFSRIIPARAGFTLFQCVLSRSAEDHPRSRGVYH